MIQGILTRQQTGDTGTFGTLTITGRRTDGGAVSFQCMTAELPCRDNARNRSCIPEGRYPCLMRDSHFGRVYELQDVPGRSAILIHYGNWAGDESLGFVSDVEGCILVGEHRAPIEWNDRDAGRSGMQLGVTNSRKTLSRLHAATHGECMLLTVVEAFPLPAP